MSSTAPRQAGLAPSLSRTLTLFTRVEPSEVATALLLTFNAFLLLTAYACIKPVREALILTVEGGAEYKAYASAVVGTLLMLVLPSYAKLATRLARNRLILATSGFFSLNLLGFYTWASSGAPAIELGLAFYVWVNVFNMMIVAQFWAFATDIYTEDRGKRLFPLLGLGASLGAVVGSWFAAAFIRRIDSLSLLLVAAAILLLSAGASEWTHLRELHRHRGTPRQQQAREPVAGEGALRLVIHDRYLRWIAAFAVAFTVVRTNGDYILARLVKQAADDAVLSGALSSDDVRDFVGNFYARFLLYVDGTALLVQAFLVSRIVRRLGVFTSLLILPGVAMLQAGGIALWPLLVLAMPSKVAENALDYSLNNTLRNMLWLPTTRHAKYVAKQAVDTFFVRLGDVTSAVLVYAGAHVMGWSVRAFGLMNLVGVVVWLIVTRNLTRSASPGVDGDEAFVSRG